MNHICFACDIKTITLGHLLSIHFLKPTIMAVSKCIMKFRKDSHLAPYLQLSHTSTALAPTYLSCSPSTSKWRKASPITITPYGIDLGKYDGQLSLSDPFLNDTNKTNESRATQSNKTTAILWDQDEVPNRMFSPPLNLQDSPSTTRQREATETELDDPSDDSSLAATKNLRIRTQYQKINRLRSRNNRLSAQVKNNALALVAIESAIHEQKDVIERLRLRIQQLEFEYTTQEIKDKDCELRGVIMMEVVG
jgi:hypothetical protein